VSTGARAVQSRSQDGGSSSLSSLSSSSSPSSSSRSAASVGIYGGGAAGLAAAYFAAQNPDLAVTVYEKTGEVGRKIKVRSIDPSMTDDE
jgi:NADPH-dependent 2,4-dienoyl-CoA reductase/sulfur reductase-like enzyme